jgi:hypothetical protein
MQAINIQKLIKINSSDMLLMEYRVFEKLSKIHPKDYSELLISRLFFEFQLFCLAGIDVNQIKKINKEKERLNPKNMIKINRDYFMKINNFSKHHNKNGSSFNVGIDRVSQERKRESKIFDFFDTVANRELAKILQKMFSEELIDHVLLKFNITNNLTFLREEVKIKPSSKNFHESVDEFEKTLLGVRQGA